MDKDEMIRKVVHMCAPLFALAYLIPEQIGPVSRDVVVIVFWIIFAAFEFYRIKKGIPIKGLREYEYHRPSAAFWMYSAFVPMILFFPVDYAIPLLIGFGFIDPLCGILRKRWKNAYPFLPLALYYVIMMTSLSISYGVSGGVAVVSIIVTISAIAAEGYKNRIVDDDFLMLFVPLIALWLSGYVLL